MENNIPLLLEEYDLCDILERLDISEEEALEFLLDTGFVTWGELTVAMPLPVTLSPLSIDNEESETSEWPD